VGTFWISQTLPAVQIAPASISFGKVTVGEAAVRTVTITNTGHADLIITIPAPAGNIFDWTPVSGQVIAPGAAFAPDVQFTARGVGLAHGQIRVDSNAAGSPHLVPLSGTGQKGTPA